MNTWIGGVALVALAACSAAGGVPRPRDVQAGADACEYCHMQVDDVSMAAQFVEAAGRVRMFDEPGCLVAWMEDHPEAVGTAFVADAAGGEWVPAELAVWVRHGAKTGMGFDLVTFRDPADAAARARASGGTVVDWRTVVREGVGDAHAH